MHANAPNLLFIMTDHQRADSIGAVHCGIEVTPHLNRLAEQGTHFPRAWTTCPLCTPARTALATGLHPVQHGVMVNDWKGRTAGAHRPLHQYLAAHGYVTAHIGVHHIRVRPDLRQRVRFDLWYGVDDWRGEMRARGLDPAPREGTRAFQRKVLELQEGRWVEAWYSSTRTALWPHPAEHFLDNRLCDAAVDWLVRNPRRPFALFLYLWAPHPPLRVPQPYASMFPPDRIDLPPNVGRPARGEPPSRRRSVPAQLAEGITEEEWRRVWSAHLGLVRLADEGIGRVMKALERLDLTESTIVVFTVDHGEHLGQHAMYQKMELYEPAVRIPLIIRTPGGRPGSIDRAVSHTDILPTLLDLLDIPESPPGNACGLSLRAAVEHGDPPPERPVFLQYAGNPVPGMQRRGVIEGRWKYVWDPDDLPELYDLETDPLEMTNLAGTSEHTGIQSRLHALAAARFRSWGDTIRWERPEQG